jgi:hypothetical protein
MGIRLTTYYTVAGTVLEDEQTVTVGGTVIVWSSYFRDQGLVDRTESYVVQRTHADGTVEIVREWVRVGRGPEGAPVYPEYVKPSGN